MWWETRTHDGAGGPARGVPQVRRRVAVRRLRVHGRRARARVPLPAVQLRPVLRVLLLSRGAAPRAPAPVPPRVPPQPRGHRGRTPLQRVPRAARVCTGLHRVPQPAVPRVSRVLQRLPWSVVVVLSFLVVARCSALSRCGQCTDTSTAWSWPRATRRTPSTTAGGTATAAARAAAACRRCSTARSAATTTSAATAPLRASGRPLSVVMVTMMTTKMAATATTIHEHITGVPKRVFLFLVFQIVVVSD